jgi:hypothetical protein
MKEIDNLKRLLKQNGIENVPNASFISEALDKLIELQKAGMTDLDKLKATYADIDIPFVVREQDEYSYLFQGKPEDASDIRWREDNFETTNLDTLTMRNAFFEFEHGKLVSH